MNMAKSYSHSSLGRDFMNVGSGSKFGQQGSRGLLSAPSSKNLPSIFSLGSRAPPPMSSQHRDEPNQANKILASFGLSSRDLDELSRYPEEKITPESLPQLIQQIKRRRSEDMSMLSYRERVPREPLRVSSSDWDDDVRPFRRESFVDRPSGLDHVVDYDHGSRAREPAYRERLDLDDRLRDRERFREDSYVSDTSSSFRKLGTDYEPMSYSQPQERSAFTKARGMPSVRNIDDFHGIVPKDFPHLCSLCDIPIHTKKGWNDHINGPTHRRHRLLLLEVYPEWNGHGMGDPLMLRQSTNHAPGILGPPPPAPQSLLSMGSGPERRRGNQREHPGMEERGPRRVQNRPHGGGGRVVHIINFERGRNLKNQLLRLAEPFGEITNHLILNKMNEAFIEMSNAEDAMAAVDYYTTNQAIIMGKPVRVHLSQKYKRIKKSDPKPEIKPEQKKTEPGRVVHVSKLPSLGYTDAALLKLAETFGKVKSYILMRVRNQAFIEMERVEDAHDMVKQCEIVPLLFHGKTLKVDLSERYKKLVLRIPNKLLEEKEKSRKRTHSPDRRAAVKDKQKKTEVQKEITESGDGEAASDDVTADDTIHTSEETDQKDIVTDSCEPELLEEDDVEEEEEEEAAALLETSSSVADDEVLDTNDAEDRDGEDDQMEAQEPDSSATYEDVSEEKAKRTSRYSGSIDDFVTLDEVGDEEDLDKIKAEKSSEKRAKMDCSSVMASTSVEETEQENEAEQENATEQEEAAEKETGEMPPTSQSESAQASESTAESNTIAEFSKDYVLAPYQPNNPIGVDFVVPKTGFYCKLCSLFYTNEDVAKVTHCSTLPHYQKLKKLLNKMARNPEKKN